MVDSKPEKGKKIYIVEDDQFLREIAMDKLRNEGYEIVGISSGKELFEKLEGEEEGALPDIILLDLVLQGMSGFEMLEKLKADESYKAVPVIVLSNLGADEDVKRAKDLGARDYMVKAHFTFADILKKIQESLA